MDKDLYDDIKDADWEPAKREVGEISFKKVTQGKKAKCVLRTMSFILIAVVSGGASGAYIIDRKYANKTINQPTDTHLIISRGQDFTVVNKERNVTAKIVENVAPAVVGISNKIEGFEGQGITGCSSGIIYDSKGYIITNNQAVEGSDIITVKLSNGKTFPAKKIGFDSKSNLAVIKIESVNLPTVTFGDSSRVSPGEVAVAIGNRLGEESTGTVTAGIISTINKRVKCEDTYYRLLQTDAVINSSNSGGPLCNELGEVIGINLIKIGSNSYENIEGVGFALSINDVKVVIKNIVKTVGKNNNNGISDNKNFKTQMGITAENTNKNLNEEIKGVYVREVVKGSSAATAGFKPADIIIEADNGEITSVEELDEVLNRHKAREILICKVWRDGKIIELTICLSS